MNYLKSMINLYLKRFPCKGGYTVGRLYKSKGGEYICDTLEDENRDSNKNGVFDNGEKKVYGKTCIPYGEYKVKMDWSPKFSPRYGHKIPFILNVHGFENVRIHRGNTPDDSLGCILVGYNTIKGGLTNSKDAETKLFCILKDQDCITLTIE